MPRNEVQTVTTLLKLRVYRELANIGLRLAGIVALGSLAWLFLHPTIEVRNAKIEGDVHAMAKPIAETVRSVKEDVSTTAHGIQDTVAKLGSTAEIVNGALLDKQKGIQRTMAVSYDAIHAYATLAQDLHQTAIDERDAIQDAGNEIVGTAKNLNLAVGDTRFTFGALTRTADDFDARIKDPRIDLMLGDSQTIVHNAALATTDGQVYLHGALFPVKKHGWARFRGYGVDTAKVGWAGCRISGYCPF